MAEELIKERPSSYTAPLAIEHPLSPKGSEPVIHFDRFTSTIASCNDFPPPIHAAKALFFEDQEFVAIPLKEQQQKEKASLLKRLTLANIKAEMQSYYSRSRDTLSSWKDKAWNFFGWEKSTKKVEVATKNAAVSKSAYVAQNTEVSQVHLENIEKVEPINKVEPVNNEKVDVEKKRITEIEDLLCSFEEEWQKSGGGNIKTMMEMAIKMHILLGTLGEKYNKKEMKDYIEHLEINVKKRVETFEGKRVWAWVSIAVNSVAAVASLAGLGGAAGGTVGGIFKAVGQVAGPLGTAGGSFEKIDTMQDQQKQGIRTDLEHDGEKIKQWKSDMDRTNEKTHQSRDQMMAAWRNIAQAHSEAIKRVASAG